VVRQIENLGLDPEKVTEYIISHLDNGRISSLPDFPNAAVHVSMEELDHFNLDNPIFLRLPLVHNPTI